eukprot:COSAG02_NODE_2260_length_9317_cov_10.918365_9_plen_105_part_00
MASMVMEHRVDLVSAIMKHVDPTALDACKLVSPVFYRAVKEYLQTVTPEDAFTMLFKNAHQYASLGERAPVAKMYRRAYSIDLLAAQYYLDFILRSILSSIVPE